MEQVGRRMEQVRDGMRRLLVRMWHGQRGEGVISAAIAVLIVAFIGAAMWVAFNAIFNDAASSVAENVGRIGR